MSISNHLITNPILQKKTSETIISEVFLLIPQPPHIIYYLQPIIHCLNKPKYATKIG